MRRSLLVASIAVAGSLIAAVALSGAAVGGAMLVADGWDQIGALFVIGLLLFPAWCAVSLLMLRVACRRWLGLDPGVAALAGVAVAGASVGAGATWLAATGVLPGGDWGPVVYGPIAAVATVAALLTVVARRPVPATTASRPS